MKFEFHAEMGISGCSEDEVVEIPDADLAGVKNVDDVIRRYFEDWLSNVVSAGWEEVDDDR